MPHHGRRRSYRPVFIAACGVAVLGVAVTQAGWTHKVFVGFLFALAASLFLIATFWKTIKDFNPQLSSGVSMTAESSTAWFALLVVGFGVVFVLDFGARVGWFTSDRAPHSQLKPRQAEERIFIDIDFKELVGLYKGRTSLQGDALAAAYIGKWIQATADVHDISESQHQKGIVKVTAFDTSLGAMAGLVMLNFTGEHGQQAKRLVKGKRMTAIGKVDTIASGYVTLDRCELVETAS